MTSIMCTPDCRSLLLLNRVTVIKCYTLVHDCMYVSAVMFFTAQHAATDCDAQRGRRRQRPGVVQLPALSALQQPSRSRQGTCAVTCVCISCISLTSERFEFHCRKYDVSVLSLPERCLLAGCISSRVPQPIEPASGHGLRRVRARQSSGRVPVLLRALGLHTC